MRDEAVKEREHTRRFVVDSDGVAHEQHIFPTCIVCGTRKRLRTRVVLFKTSSEHAMQRSGRALAAVLSCLLLAALFAYEQMWGWFATVLIVLILGCTHHFVELVCPNCGSVLDGPDGPELPT